MPSLQSLGIDPNRKTGIGGTVQTYTQLAAQSTANRNAGMPTPTPYTTIGKAGNQIINARDAQNRAAAQNQTRLNNLNIQQTPSGPVQTIPTYDQNAKQGQQGYTGFVGNSMLQQAQKGIYGDMTNPLNVASLDQKVQDAKVNPDLQRQSQNQQDAFNAWSNAGGLQGTGQTYDEFAANNTDIWHSTGADPNSANPTQPSPYKIAPPNPLGLTDTSNLQPITTGNVTETQGDFQARKAYIEQQNTEKLKQAQLRQQNKQQDEMRNGGTPVTPQGTPTGTTSTQTAGGTQTFSPAHAENQQMISNLGRFAQQYPELSDLFTAMVTDLQTRNDNLHLGINAQADQMLGLIPDNSDLQAYQDSQRRVFDAQKAAQLDLAEKDKNLKLDIADTNKRMVQIARDQAQVKQTLAEQQMIRDNTVKEQQNRRMANKLGVAQDGSGLKWMQDSIDRGKEQLTALQKDGLLLQQGYALQITKGYQNTVNQALNDHEKTVNDINASYNEANATLWQTVNQTKTDRRKEREAIESKRWEMINQADMKAGDHINSAYEKMFDAGVQATRLLFDKQSKVLSLAAQHSMWYGNTDPNGAEAYRQSLQHLGVPTDVIDGVITGAATLHQATIEGASPYIKTISSGNYQAPDGTDVGQQIATLLQSKTGNQGIQLGRTALDKLNEAKKTNDYSSAIEYRDKLLVDSLQGSQKDDLITWNKVVKAANEAETLLDALKKAGYGDNVLIEKKLSDLQPFILGTKDQNLIKLAQAVNFASTLVRVEQDGVRFTSAEMKNQADSFINGIGKEDLLTVRNKLEGFKKLSEDAINSIVEQQYGHITPTTTAQPPPGSVNFKNLTPAQQMLFGTFFGQGGGNLPTDKKPQTFQEYIPTIGTITQDYGGTYSVEKGYYTDGRKTHEAYDLAGAAGQPIPAFRGGTVEQVVHSDKGYGNHVIVALPDGYKVIYGHLNDISVKAGDTLSDNQILGTEGETGNADGPHLHFEVRDRNGTPVDPSVIFNQ